MLSISRITTTSKFKGAHPAERAGRYKGKDKSQRAGETPALRDRAAGGAGWQRHAFTGFRDDVAHDGLQIAGFFIHAQLALGAGAVAEDSADRLKRGAAAE